MRDFYKGPFFVTLVSYIWRHHHTLYVYFNLNSEHLVFRLVPWSLWTRSTWLCSHSGTSIRRQAELRTPISLIAPSGRSYEETKARNSFIWIKVPCGVLSWFALPSLQLIPLKPKRSICEFGEFTLLGSLSFRRYSFCVSKSDLGGFPSFWDKGSNERGEITDFEYIWRTIYANVSVSGRVSCNRLQLITTKEYIDDIEVSGSPEPVREKSGNAINDYVFHIVRKRGLANITEQH